jgi:hypothetical protein
MDLLREKAGAFFLGFGAAAVLEGIRIAIFG